MNIELAPCLFSVLLNKKKSSSSIKESVRGI